MDSQEKRLDLVVFGASGFTGKYTVLEILKLRKENGSLTWGVAGRNKDKLQSCLEQLGRKTGEDLSKVPIIEADVNNYDSLLNMTSKAVLIINCAGPYRFFGEPVVKACISNGTHQVDVTGEPQYMERMQLEYHKAAQDKGVYIVSACGFDSIPADLGVVFVQQKFGGDVNSVESYLNTEYVGTEKGAGIHYGTWESAVYGVAHSNELRSLREKLFPNRLPRFTPRLQRHSVLHRKDAVDGWCLPFPGSDRSVVTRSQRYFYEQEKKRPAQFEAYLILPSLFYSLVLMFVAVVFALLTRFKLGIKLLLNYPRIFTFGVVSHEGPTESMMADTHFTFTLFAEGWKDTLSEPTDQHAMPINKKMTVQVKGTNPGYGATCTTLVLSALTILKEKDKMPPGGGVLTPGVAFAKTSLIEELNKHGVTFEVISTEELNMPVPKF